MHADVPLGAFLSGGIDSSTVVAMMQAQSMRPVQTFSIALEDEDYNEGSYASAVARHLGTTHTQITVRPEDALEVIPRLPTMYDEPFADSSQIPTYLVSDLARRSVTVSLSGDGGDELFGGYDRYRWTPALWKRLACFPVTLRGLVAKAVCAVPNRIWHQVEKSGLTVLGGSGFRHPLAVRLRGQMRMIAAASPEELFQLQTSFWSRPADVIRGYGAPTPIMLMSAEWPIGFSIGETMMAVDSVSYLSDDILAKVDRASMAVSLESRVPFLDPELFTLAWRIPLEQKIRGTQGKWILRKVLARYVPEHVFDRPKKGFSVPIGKWMRGPLRDWAESLLSCEALKASGLIDPDPVRRMWHGHILGKGPSWEGHLWPILMLQAWLLDQPSVSPD
jgi:asparagine synthase (glutamine-hydrolysing)